MSNDIFLLNQLTGVYPDGEFALSFGNQVKAVTGIQKLINRFLLYFLTGTGSELTNSRFGTSLGTYIGGNLIPLLKSKIRLDVAKTALAIKADQADVPDDEALDSVKVINLIFSPGTIDLTLRFKSKANETVTVKVPSITG
jgi:hypothetical protein